MRVTYDGAARAAYIYLCAPDEAQARHHGTSRIDHNVLVDHDRAGVVLGIEILSVDAPEMVSFDDAPARTPAPGGQGEG